MNHNFARLNYSMLTQSLDGDAGYFPTFEQSAEKIAAVEAAAKEDANPAAHFDATQEVRARAAGFYQFSKDEETRQKQMEDLKRTREETERAREDSGASMGKEVRPGMEKRKREREERRRAVEAKRRKTKNDNGKGKDTVEVGRVSETSSTKPRTNVEQSADEFLAALERDIMGEKG